MAKQGATKEQILKLIFGGMNNLSDISKALSLAPSTVSKHLHDLEEVGAIEQEENEHLKKWKYYRIRQQPDESQIRELVSHSRDGGFRSSRNVFIGAAIIMALLVISGIGYAALNPAQKTASVGISITDPPKVPYGTQALYVNYSSLSVQTSHNGRARWVPINTSGRIDLMGLINYSEFIGNVSVVDGASITGIRLNISSADITINNQTYPAQILQPQIFASIQNNTKINGTSSMLVDFSPVVTKLYSNGSTEYILMPAIRAVFIGGGNEIPAIPEGSEGTRKSQLPDWYMGLFSNPANVVNFGGAGIEHNGNLTTVNFTITNSGKANISIFGAIIYIANSSQPENTGPGNSTDGICPKRQDIMTHMQMIKGDQIQQQGNQNIAYYNMAAGNELYVQSGSNISLNATRMFYGFGCNGTYALRINLNKSVNTITIVHLGGVMQVQPTWMRGIFMPAPGTGIGFLVFANGTLAYPQMAVRQAEGSVAKPISTGYVMAPGDTRTFAYSGNLGIHERRLLQQSTANESYHIIVATSLGPIQSNVTVN